MLIAIQIDVVVIVIDKVDESPAFVHFVGMPIAPCFKDTTPPTFAKLNLTPFVIQNTSASRSMRYRPKR